MKTYHHTVATAGTAVGAALLLLLAGCDARQRDPAAEAPQRVRVGAMTLQAQPVPLTVELPGRIVAELQSEVRPQVDGVIVQRLFVEGAAVQAGQPLYKLDAASYRAARDSAAAELTRAQAAIPAVLAKADRNRSLFQQDAISKQEFEQSSDALSQARASVATARAALDTANINLARTVIRAPISGRIERSSLTPGALVSANQTTALTTIQRLDNVYVDLTQSSTRYLDLREAIDSGRVVRAGRELPITLKLENGTTYPQQGTLEFGEASVSPSTGTYALRAQVPNPKHLLLPGMYVRAVIREGTIPHAYLVPQRAAGRNTRGEATALVVRHGVVMTVVLPDAKEHGNDWLVEHGWVAGDKLVVEGSQQVRDGDAVDVQDVALDPATGKVRPVEAAAASAPARPGSAGGAPALNAQPDATRN
ncbi:efflux RND transporter periplasmic adaptor subunit [Burkholderia sp. Ac-20379]|uniref:efflux RND transporter periplasmic adaptor subunit n=1 Tax=Burkholderia sp. Ac-20379 TaxID=2703900 RepID=UPI0030DB69C7